MKKEYTRITNKNQIILGENSDNPKKILLVLPRRFGDLLYSTPTIRAIRKKFPQSEITAAVIRYYEALLKNNKNIDRIMKSDLPTDSHDRNINYISLIEQINEIINNEDFDRIYILSVWLDKNWEEKNVKWLKEKDRHHIDWFAKVSDVILENKEMELCFGDEDEQKMMDKIGRENLADLILVHPNPGCETRQWGKENWNRLCSRLIEELGLNIAMIGSEEDRILFQNKRTKNLFGLDLGQLAALISKSKLFIGSDSGPMRIATIYKIPVVGLYGPTTPKVAGPLGTKNICLQPKIRCDDPCFISVCTTGINCIKNIPIDEVFEAVKSLI